MNPTWIIFNAFKYTTKVFYQFMHGISYVLLILGYNDMNMHEILHNIKSKVIHDILHAIK